MKQTPYLFIRRKISRGTTVMVVEEIGVGSAPGIALANQWTGLALSLTNQLATTTVPQAALVVFSVAPSHDLSVHPSAVPRISTEPAQHS